MQSTDQQAGLPNLAVVDQAAPLRGASGAVGVAVNSRYVYWANNATGAISVNMDTVLVRGRVLKSGGERAGVDLGRLRRLADQARDRLFGEAGVRPGEPWYPDVAAAWRP
jgi:hypothetical protein